MAVSPYFALASALVLGVQPGSARDTFLTSNTEASTGEPPVLVEKLPAPLEEHAAESNNASALAELEPVLESLLIRSGGRDEGASAGLAQFLGVKLPEPDLEVTWMLLAQGRGGR